MTTEMPSIHLKKEKLINRQMMGINKADLDGFYFDDRANEQVRIESVQN